MQTRGERLSAGGWRLALLLSFLTVATACGPAHIKAYEPKQRDYQLPVEPEQLEGDQAEGSLWSSANNGRYLFTDQRAIRAGDILTVRVEEFANAKRATNTKKSRMSEMNADITAFVGLMTKLQAIDPDITPSALIDTGSKSEFDHSGETGRSEKLEATVQVVVKKTLANGNLFVEGHRVILVNAEEHHFYVSGVARPFDIDETNSLSSSVLADAEIEFTGRGVLSEDQEPGWFQRAFGWIWPF